MAEPEEWRILLVDDEAGIRKVTGITLADAGYAVFTASNGNEGLSLCREKRPQVVITDVRMPGMDGITLLEKIKTGFPETEVIVVTAFEEMDIAIRALQLDASDFITKPINDDALTMALHRARQRYTEKKQVRDYTKLLEEGWNETTRELMEMFLFQKNLIESSMDGILGSSPAGVIVICNRSMGDILGFSPKEVLNQWTIDRFFAPDLYARLVSCLDNDKYGGQGQVSMFQTEMKGKEGKNIPVQLSAARITSPEGKDEGMVFFVRDLREIRRLEREMEDQARILHQDKMMSLGRLAAAVAHEINNPLAGVLNYARLMLRIVQRGEITQENLQKFGRYLELVESETDRCSRIISGLLTFSRKSAEEFREVDIRELIERSVLLSRHKLELSGIAISEKIQEGLPHIKGDFNQLQQCIINLIFNAVDAMPEGGELSIEGVQENNRVVLRVKDTGTGISEQHLPHIFEPFYTTKAEGYGVGLGLSTVYGILSRHQAEITAQSEKGKGTTFCLVFQACH